LKKLILSIMVVIVVFGCGWGQLSEINLPSGSAATVDNAFSLRVNPAGLAYWRGAELFALTYAGSGAYERNGAIYGKLWRMGFGAEFMDEAYYRYNRYYFGMGFELGYGLKAGFSYDWYRHIDIDGEWNFGLLFRPSNYLSFGAAAHNINGARVNAEIAPSPDITLGGSGMPVDGKFHTRYDFGAAVRFYGDRITLSADFSLLKDQFNDYGDSLDWRFRADLKPLEGVDLSFDYFPEVEYFGAGLTLSLRHYGFGHRMYMDDDGGRVGSVNFLHLTTDNLPGIEVSPGKNFILAELSGVIREEPPQGMFTPSYPHLSGLVKAIEKLGEDEKVEGLALKLGNLQCGYATIQEIREALIDFRETGKRLVIYANNMDNMEYYLASAAEAIYMPPTGYLNLTGLRMEITFIKGTLDKLGITAELEHMGEYKSASDLVTREGMSKAHFEADSAALEELFFDFVTEIVYWRGYDEADFRAKIDNGPYLAEAAYAEGLVDSLIYPDELEDALKAVFGGNARMVKYDKYWGRNRYEYSWGDPFLKRIAIIYADGVIVQGESGGNSFFGKLVGAETISRAIREAREDDKIKAIVLRINSPGGDGLASDLIWREVKLTVTGEDRKPLIVSMGDAAASGGYYIACRADTIVADPGTITGSIGVVSGKFNLSGFYEKIGFTKEILKRGERADYLSSSRGWSEEERELTRQMVEEFYRQFVERVAEGRDMKYDEVDEIAKGRVWTGEQAWEIGLVDEIGTLNDALQIAMQMGGLEPGERASFEFFPKSSRLNFEGLFERRFEGDLNQEVREFLGEVENSIQLMDGRVLYLMPYTPVIK